MLAPRFRNRPSVAVVVRKRRRRNPLQRAHSPCTDGPAERTPPPVSEDPAEPPVSEDHPADIWTLTHVHALGVQVQEPLHLLGGAQSVGVEVRM